jgi:Flp pilus assembly protein TadG
MTCILGLVAFAVDVGTLLHVKREMQIAADSAAIAGAAEINYNNTAAAAQAAATQNGFKNSSNGITVTVNHPYAGKANSVEVLVSQRQPTFFMKVFGTTGMTVGARAVATFGTTNQCIYTLGSTGTDISLVGNADISATTCGIVDDSSSGNALQLVGNAKLNAQSIGVVGSYSTTGNATVNPPPVTNIVPTSDPLGFLTPPAVPSTCSADPQPSGNGTATLTAGCYSGLSASGNASVSLGPGTYVINGDVSFGGNTTLSGTGVTLYLLGSTSLSGNVTLNLTAPTSGTYSGVLLYEAASDIKPISLVGNAGSTFKGIVYAKNAAVDLKGNGSSSIYTAFVVKSLSLVGNASLQDYASLNGSSVLSSVKLVE